jgi:hypothetical protein
MAQSPAIPSPTLPAAGETSATDPECENPSDLEALRQTARSGMRICAKVILLVLVCLCLKWISTIATLAFYAWPYLY